MTYAYIVFGAIVVLAIAAFAIVNLEQQHATAVATATPTPGPDANETPIPILNGEALGSPAFPSPVRANGGVPIDDIVCETGEEQMQLALHIHIHLAIFDNGKQLQVPQYIGFVPLAPRKVCLYWIHTHDASGIIHIESPQIDAPGGGHFTLGMLFDVWGQPLSRDDVAGKIGPVTAYVNGAVWTGDLRQIPMLAHQQVVLEVGKTVPPPYYSFPEGT